MYIIYIHILHRYSQNHRNVAHRWALETYMHAYINAYQYITLHYMTRPYTLYTLRTHTVYIHYNTCKQRTNAHTCLYM